MLAKVGQAKSTTGPLDVQQIPQIDNNSATNGDKGEQAHVLGRDVAREGNTSQDQPLPPLPRESLVSQLVEFDVGKQTASHGENEGRVEEDQTSLPNVGIVEENQASGHNTSRKAVSRLPHDHVYDRDGQGAEDGGERAECDIGDLVRDVRVADIVEVEVSIIAHEPAHKGEEELSKRRMDIEEVGFLEVV